MPLGSLGEGEAVAVLSEVTVDPVTAVDEGRFRDLLQAYHYLGAVPGMGETVRYVAHHHGRWLALLVFSAPALKCGARDRWIGWDYSVQFDRLYLVYSDPPPADPRRPGPARRRAPGLGRGPRLG